MPEIGNADSRGAETDHPPAVLVHNGGVPPNLFKRKVNHYLRVYAAISAWLPDSSVP
jgi:hypothetical protein